MLAKLENTEMRMLVVEWSTPSLIEEPPLLVLLTEPQRESMAFGHLKRRKLDPYLPAEPFMVRYGVCRLTRVQYRPIFRGYVFADQRAANEDLHTLPGLRSQPFLHEAGNGHLALLNARDVRRLRTIEQDLREEAVKGGPEPHCFKVGDKVKFVDNMFDDDQEFQVIGVDSNGRIRVKMRLFGAQREVPVPASKLILA